MKLASFAIASDPRPRAGILLVEPEEVLELASPATGIAAPERYLDWFDLAGESLQAATRLAANLHNEPDTRAKLRDAGALHALAAVRLLAPVPRSAKYLCIGLNYRDHAEESGMAVPESPIVFAKLPTSVIGPEQPVVLPAHTRQGDYEAELAVVIGRRAKNVPRERALDHVLGYCCTNDVSARDFQFADGQWLRGKACDTFGPLGPFLATRDEIEDPHVLAIRLRLNGKTMQDSNTDQLIFRVPELVAFLSQTITLEPGDVIATGTPPGVGFARKPPVFLRDGDVMEVEIEGLGCLRNPVAQA
jgi:2-keto-4-pentenoate hydratase/2-oxohepta-3-ene-1,7-dioic acid hydratase in catechol pathway